MNYPTDQHILPMDDFFDHEPDVNCDCRPFLTKESENKLMKKETEVHTFVHRQIKYRKDEQN